MPACAGMTENKRLGVFATPSQMMNSQKVNRMAKQKSPYTRHRVFSGAKSYM
jgi:hypothetical protein